MEVEAPYSEPAEMAVLGAMMLSNQVVMEVAGTLGIEDFYLPRHQVIFGAIQRVAARGKAVDMLTVRNELDQRGELDKVGGVAYLAALHDALPSASSGRHYAGIVKEKARLRELVSVAHEILSIVRDEETTVTDKIAKAQNLMIEVRSGDGPRELTFFQAALNLIKAPAVIGVPTGQDWIDGQSPYGGLYAGGVHLIGAPTGGCKSEAVCKLAASMVERKARLAFGTFEMTAEQNQVRINKYLSGGLVNEYPHGNPMLIDTYNQITQTIGESGSIFYDGSGEEEEVKVNDFLAWCTRQHHEQPLTAVFADYVQLLTDPSTKKDKAEYEKHMRVIRRFRAWARRTGVPVVLCVQINDDGSTRGSADYKTNSELYLLITQPEEGKFEVKAAKNRHAGGVKKWVGGFVSGILKFARENW